MIEKDKSFLLSPYYSLLLLVFFSLSPFLLFLFFSLSLHFSLSFNLFPTVSLPISFQFLHFSLTPSVCFFFPPSLFISLFLSTHCLLLSLFLSYLSFSSCFSLLFHFLSLVSCFSFPPSPHLSFFQFLVYYLFFCPLIPLFLSLLISLSFLFFLLSSLSFSLSLPLSVFLYVNSLLLIFFSSLPPSLSFNTRFLPSSVYLSLFLLFFPPSPLTHSPSFCFCFSPFPQFKHCSVRPTVFRGQTGNDRVRLKKRLP